MSAKYILAALSVIFITLAARRLGQAGGKLNSQARTWFIVGGIFGAVSVWLFSRQ